MVLQDTQEGNTIMDLNLYFKNINSTKNKDPFCKIILNNNEVWKGKVQEHISFKYEAEKSNILQIHFDNKTNRDTVVDLENKIIEDLNFELEKIVIDDVDFKHLIWQSKYIADNNVIESCLFFGPKGYFEIKFDLPILKWWLKVNHLKNNNDPTWETDYKYYEEVCQGLNKIQQR